MGKLKKKVQDSDSLDVPKPPELVHRRENRKSTFRSGRTIGEKRERLETANERMAARKKQKHRKAFRIIFTIICFLSLILILVFLFLSFLKNHDDQAIDKENNEEYSSTIEIIDEEASTEHITSKMNNFIARAEKEFRNLGYTPIKAVIPSGAIRSINFYLNDYTGFIKMTIDRSPAVSVEDADRILHYLSDREINDFTYIDVRIEGKAYWK